MNDTAYFERHVSHKNARILGKYISPTQMAQQSLIAIDLAYATAAERIKAAKAACDERRKRKMIKA